MSGIITANPGGDTIRSVAVDLHSKKIAVTSEYAPPYMTPTGTYPRPRNSDKAVKVIDLRDTKKIVVLEGHSRGVRRAAWHPSGALLVRLSPLFVRSFLIRKPRSGHLWLRWEDHHLGRFRRRTKTREDDRRYHPHSGRYTVSTLKHSDVALIDGIYSRAPEYCHDCSVVWHPSGQYFVVVTRTQGLFDNYSSPHVLIE